MVWGFPETVLVIGMAGDHARIVVSSMLSSGPISWQGTTIQKHVVTAYWAYLCATIKYPACISCYYSVVRIGVRVNNIHRRISTVWE